MPFSIGVQAKSQYSNMVRINNKTIIPDNELSFTFSRSKGPGGQNVNKVSTRVTLRFDVGASTCLTGTQRALIMKKLDSHINSKGILQIHAGRHRSQHTNRKDAIDRFTRLLASALRQKPLRKKTKLPNAVKARRLKDKRHRSKIKRARSKHIALDSRLYE